MNGINNSRNYIINGLGILLKPFLHYFQYIVRDKQKDNKLKFQRKNTILKSGHLITIRVPEQEEAQHLIDLKRSYIKGSSTIPLTLEEYPVDLKKESNLIKEYQENENSILLIAEFNNKFIGNIDLIGSKRYKMLHTAMIAIGIKEEWRNQGLGKLLIESVIEWAKIYSKIEIIWLDVYSSNEIGYNLYKNTGFKVSGIINNFFKEENGYKNKVQMYQHIK